MTIQISESQPSLSIVMPVHNESAILEQSLGELRDYLATQRVSECRVLLVENGSSDSSADVVQRLEAEQPFTPVFTISSFLSANAGLGYAYERGVKEALSRCITMEDHWVVLTVADLPFGFTDFASFLKARQEPPGADAIIASKAHPASRVDMGIRRKTVTFLFQMLRRLLLNMKVRDSQGVFFITADAASRICPLISARNYFYTTELVFHAERHGLRLKEVPIVYAGERRKSSVRVFRDGALMLKQLIALRRSGHRSSPQR